MHKNVRLRSVYLLFRKLTLKGGTKEEYLFLLDSIAKSFIISHMIFALHKDIGDYQLTHVLTTLLKEFKEGNNNKSLTGSSTDRQIRVAEGRKRGIVKVLVALILINGNSTILVNSYIKELEKNMLPLNGTIESVINETSQGTFYGHAVKQRRILGEEALKRMSGNPGRSRIKVGH